MWAADRVAALAATDDAQAALVELSRKFSVASPALSFIVLEAPSDYVAAGITPPSNYPSAALQQYRELVAEADADKRLAARRRLEDVSELWEAQKQWWAAKFATRPRKESPATPAPARVARAAPMSGAGEAEEVMVTAARARGPANAGYPGPRES